MLRHVCVFIQLFHSRLPAAFCQTMSRPTPTASSTPLCWIILGPRPRREASKTQIFNLWIANNSCKESTLNDCVLCSRDVNKPLHPGPTCALFVFQVEDVFTVGCLFLIVPRCFSFGFWQQISLDGINKLEFRCFFCVTPGLLPGVLLCYWSL